MQRVIQATQGSQSWGSDAVVAAMRQGTPTGALVSIFVLPRNFDGRLPGKAGAKPGEALVSC